MPTPQGVYQPSFGAGEISEELFGRVDLARYKSGAALLKNFFVSYQGGAISRPGTQFLNYAYDETKRVRMVPFIFSQEPGQSYALEFGHEYIRIWLDGELVLNAGLTVLVIATPYQDNDIRDLSFSQANDTMTITGREYEPRDFVRDTSHVDGWNLLQPTVFEPKIDPPTSVTVVNTQKTAGTAPSDTRFSYIVTSVGADGDESRSSTPGTVQGVNITAAEGTNKISWTAPAAGPAPDYYRIYRISPVVNTTITGTPPHGFIGTSRDVNFVDSNIIPDFTQGPPHGTGIRFDDTDDYPAVSTYFAQRKVYASTNNAPQTLFASKPGNFDNMDVGTPVNAGDALVLTLASTQANRIQFLQPVQGGLTVGTSGAIWNVANPFTPINNSADVLIEIGSAAIAPLPINFDLLYVEAHGGAVSTILYNQNGSATKVGQQLSVLANHLFQDKFGKNREVREWAWARTPHSVAWVVMTDGSLLSFTFLREQEVFAWAQHSTSGRFESVCVVPENGRDVAYFVVRRLRDAGGADWEERRMIERFVPRDNWVLSEDAWCVDAGLATSLTYPAADIEFENATGSGVGDTVVLKARGAGIFVGGDLNKIVRVGGGIGQVTTVTSSSRIKITISTPIPLLDSDIADFPVPSGSWSMTSKFSTVTGLSHLRGRTVAIVGDGEVMAAQVVPVGGSITLTKAVSRCVVGLPYTCQLKTLPLDISDGSIQGRRRRSYAVTAKIAKSRGLKIGPSFDELEDLDEKLPVVIPTQLLDGDWRTTIPPLVDTASQVHIEQSQPLPAIVLSVTPEVDVGDDA